MNKKIKNIYKYVWFWFGNLSIYKYILIVYLLITLLGSLILMMPISQTGKADIKYIDLLFVSASAFSDTGLTTIKIFDELTSFGQAIIAILILTGGIGIFSLKIYFFNIIFYRTISYKLSMILSTERGVSNSIESRKLIKISINFILFTIVLFSIILAIYFYFTPVNMTPVNGVVNFQDSLGISPYQDWGLSWKYGLFHSISAINNAGFDIIGGYSLAPYYFNYGIQIIFIILLFLGGVGFPVFYDVYLWVRSKYTKEIFKWSLLTKISITTYVVMTVVGFLLILLIEIGLEKEQGLFSFWTNERFGHTGNKVMAIIFVVFSTRSAGFSTFTILDFSSSTQLVFLLLMFVGAGPSSTGGGIRTTTIAVVLMNFWSSLLGRPKLVMHKKAISQETINKSYLVFSAAIILTFIISAFCIFSFKEYGGLINDTVTPETSGAITIDDKMKYYSATNVFFEVVSAFGTTGLTSGITQGLKAVSKIFLLICMFIGQLGISSTILFWRFRNLKSKNFSFSEESVSVG